MCSAKPSQLFLTIAALTVVTGTSVLGDQVTLKNGDRVTGKIVKKDGDSLSFKSDAMGDLTIKWADVATLASDQPVWVVLPDGSTVSGPLKTTGGRVQIAAPGQSREVPVAQVEAMRNADEQARFDRLLHPPLTDLWSGYIDVGLAAARGNSQTTTFTTNFFAARVTGNDQIRLYLNQIYARGLIENRVTDTAKAIRGGWAYDRNVNSHLFVNVFNDYEHDRFQNLDLRFVVGGGLGYHVFKTDIRQLDVLAGISYNRENYSIPLSAAPGASNSRNSAEAFWGDDFLYRLSGITSLKQSFRMFNNLSRTGEYRVNFDLGIDTKLKKWLSWQISFADRYITDPAPTRKTNDLLLTTGVRLSFAQ